ncbi:MAG TPA: hypothetical protein PLD25_11300 [Chloroflexota bacterium]|nr:hypothetical protein [Chloroflexota bacterium]
MTRVLVLFFILLLTSCGGSATAVSTTTVRETAVSVTAVSPTPVPSPTTIPTSSFYAIELSAGQQTLVEIDHVFAVRHTIFQIPTNGWLASFDLWPVAASGGQFVLAYAPPPPPGEINFGFTGLYLMPQDGGELEPLLTPQEDGELFFNPVWTVDGQSIYFSHVRPRAGEEYTFDTTLERLHLPTGQIDHIADEAIWPQLSPDGTMLAYVLIESDTLANALVIAEPDGSNAREVVEATRFTAVDAPIFSPDNQMLYFSAVEPSPVQSWWQKMWGVQVAAAHNLPSDWYRIPVAGGEPERLTELNGVGLYGRFAPDGVSLFAFVSQGGIYEMATDGTDLRKWLEGTFTDSLAWTP